MKGISDMQDNYEPDYFDRDEPVILVDRETGEEYFINPGGVKVWVA